MNMIFQCEVNMWFYVFILWTYTCGSKSVFIYECWSLACLSGDISDEFSGYRGCPKENLQIKSISVSLGSLSLHFLICKLKNNA